MFAQKVMVTNYQKRTTQNDGSAQKRAELQNEINHPRTKVNIDRSVFTKTEFEKERLKICKRSFRARA